MLYIIPIVYFGSLIAFSIYAALYLFFNKYDRPEIKEIADYEWCPFWKEIQSDMGLITEYNMYFNGKPAVTFNICPTTVLDIGSGNGLTSSILLKAIFGDISLTLSDLHPNIESWNRIDNIKYIANPIDINTNSLKGYSMISLLNSLHHLNDGLIDSLFKKGAAAKSSIFIMDAKRLAPYHPLLVPIGYYWIYVLLTLRGIVQRGELFKIKSLLQIFVVPWIMAMDQMIGSMRRYHIDTVRKLAKRYSYKVLLREDSLMNYIVLEPTTLWSRIE